MHNSSANETAYSTINRWTIPGSAIPCPHRRHDIEQELLDGEAILFDPINGATFRLNRSALEVWEGCRPGRLMDDLSQDMCHRYDIDESTARDDVQQMIAMFANHGLLDA